MMIDRPGRRGGWLIGALLLSIPASTTVSAAPPDSARLAGHRPLQIALTTSDLPRAIAFYRNVLGLPLMFETNGMAFFDLAGMRLMIALDPKRPRVRPTSVLYLDAPDLDSAIARMAALGVAFDGGVETVGSAATGELRSRQFTDPDGNALAVMAATPRR